MFRFEFLEFGNKETVEVELANIEAACAQAVREARDALADGVTQRIDRSSSVTKIYDEAGYLVASVNYADHVRDVPLPKDESEDTETDEPGVIRSG
jgi:hypothetical protein